MMVSYIIVSVCVIVYWMNIYVSNDGYNQFYSRMSKRVKQNIQNSKLYNPNWLSLTHNNDSQHEKLWDQKIEEAKHIQEQKQIDRILFGIVKERLFGQLLAHDTRISDQGFYALDRISKDFINPIPRPSRKICPLPNQPAYDLTRSRLKHKTIDISSSNSRSRSLYQVHQPSSQLTTIQPPPQLLPKPRKTSSHKQPLPLSKLPNIQSHFRELCNNHTSMLYDLKLTKQMVIKYNKSKGIVSLLCLEKFLYFFNFVGGYNVKQYTTWIQGVFGCTMRESSFVVFQLLDQSRNGYLTVADIFQALQDFAMLSSPLLQKQIYELMQKIKETETIKLQQIKPTVEQIIVRNQTLKLEQMRQLLKESSKELVSANTFKSTAYHKSMYALQHTAASREKNFQIEDSENDNNRSFSQQRRIKGELREQGLRFSEYANLFSNRRSQFFLLFAQLLLGDDAAVLWPM